MKKYYHRPLCLLAVFVLLLLTLCPLCSYANDYVKWELSENEQTLTDGETVYTRYYLPLGVFTDAAKEYVYENTIMDDCVLSSTVPGGDIVWYNSDYVFVTDRGKEMLDAYLEKNEGIFRVSKADDGKEGELAVEIVSLLDALSDGEGQTVSVKQLQDQLAYTLYLYDNSDIFCREYAGFYTLSDGLYYVCYDDLGNNCFDADGRFSYRSGEVTLYRLDDAASLAVEDAYADATYREYDTTWESDTDEETFGVIFPLAYAFWGFCLPTVFLVLGIVLPIRKRGKHWRILIPLSGVWMLLSVALLIVIL